MRRSKYPEIIDDVIEYGLDYFNKNNTEEREYCKKLKNDCVLLHDCIYPFFFYDGKRPDFISFFLKKHKNYHTDGINNLIKLIKNKKLLKKEVFDYLFFNFPEDIRKKAAYENDPETVYKILDNYSWPSEMKIEIVKLLNYFDYVSFCLEEDIIKIIDHIEKINQKHRDIV